MFQTKYKREKAKPEKNCGSTRVEMAGYIPAKVQIENLMLAGQRLNQYRKEQYDFQPDQEDDDNFVDPTRRPGYDMADMAQDALALDRRLKDQKKAQEEMNEAKSKKEAAEAQKDVSEASEKQTEAT